MIPEWLIIAAAGAGIAWPALVELARGKTPEEVVEIILTYPGTGGDPNATDNRGGGGRRTSWRRRRKPFSWSHTELAHSLRLH